MSNWRYESFSLQNALKNEFSKSLTPELIAKYAGVLREFYARYAGVLREFYARYAGFYAG